MENKRFIHSDLEQNHKVLQHSLRGEVLTNFLWQILALARGGVFSVGPISHVEGDAFEGISKHDSGVFPRA